MGAGAEGPGNFDLPTGIEFLKESLMYDNSKTYLSALKKFFNDRFEKKDRCAYFNNTYKYTKHQVNSGDQIYKTIGERVIYFLCENGKKDDIQRKTAKLRKKINITEFKKIIDKEINSYEELTNPFLKDLLKEYEGKADFENLFDIGIAGILDKYFPSVAAPKKFPSTSFSIIFNYYWTCYLFVVERILKSLEKKGILGNEFSDFFDFKKKEVKVFNIIKNIHKFTHIFYNLFNNLKSEYPNSYYALIKKELEEKSSEICCKGIITTNYYCFSEIVLENVAYLNGKLSLFEYPELLEVKDYSQNSESENEFAEKENEKRLFFPFIFGQSYTKPIVSSKQTEEFHKMYEILDASDVLVILGYNINVDDNHINSFLKEFMLKPEKNLIFVAYNDAKLNAESLCKKLCDVDHVLENKIFVLNIEPKNDCTNENTVKTIFEKIKSICQK